MSPPCGWILRNIVDGDLKRWPLTSKIVKEGLCGFTMRTSGSEKHLDARIPFSRSSACPATDSKNTKLYRETRQKAELVSTLDRHSVLTGDIRSCDGPNVGQYIQHLLIRQLPSKAVHGAEQHAVRDSHQEFPIGLGTTFVSLKVGWQDDQVLAVWTVPVEFGPMTTETLLFVHSLSGLRIPSDDLSEDHGSREGNECHRESQYRLHLQSFHRRTNTGQVT